MFYATNLLQSQPTPFDLRTVIRYYLVEDSKVVLKVYNILGEEAKVLLDEYQPLGLHQVVWDGRDNSKKSVPCGVYFLKFNAGEYTATKKLLKVR